MVQKKSIMGAAAFFLVAALFVGYFALAAEIGGKENPLVTLDYLKNLDPQIEAAIESVVKDKVDSRMAEFDAKLTQAYQQLDELAANGAGGDISALLGDEEFINRVAAEIAGQIGGSAISGDGIAPVAVRVEVEANKTLHLPMGSQIMLRLGSGTVVASSSPGLIDTTDGSTLDNGGTLKQNHMYTVTMEAGRDIKCTSKMTVFVWGPYTVS